MARPLRIEFAGALYHVTSRGDRREDIYLDDVERMMFLEVLGEVCERFQWACHAYCLMSNHYHLLIETRDSTLAKGMRHLNGVFTQRSNRRHRRVGHVFQGRYKAILIQKEAYLLEVARYVVLNPVRAGMVRSVNDWPWSSYRATAGWVDVPPWLSIDWLLSAFGTRRKAAREAYRRFVSEGRGAGSIWDDLKRQMYLGDEAFVDRMIATLEGDALLDEVPTTQHRPPPMSLQQYAKAHRDRDHAIAAAYASGGYSMKTIGDHFGLHYSMVSRVIKKSRDSRFKT
ncbi:REP-associated tyrosine transposase [Dokdonella immobilis]|uniref:REP element-mobilizing transposase RayT n=1 Tax=Dokdonella immobilis TaxID=578942 RepID=A0A1I4VIP5_9GAMM|nr:transposase [Dokdonella immobilis]SFN01079.1 REP element-mobilizing transposase RayT [Dokdonella immobilis]